VSLDAATKKQISDKYATGEAARATINAIANPTRPESATSEPS